MIQHHCLSCEDVVPHRHMHDTAHGISGTHMDGSERFECTACGRTTFSHSDGAEAFTFLFDTGAQRERAAGELGR